jgi:hypothetical protein
MGPRAWQDWLGSEVGAEDEPYAPPDYRYREHERVPVDVVFQELFPAAPEPDPDAGQHRRQVRPPSSKQAGMADKAAPWCSPDWTRRE